MVRLLSCLLIAGCLMGCASATDGVVPVADRSAVAALVEDVCDANIVFLGEEGHHGGGTTITVKTEIVRELIQVCGFTHLAFESQMYDFIDLQERYAAGAAPREALYDAIGGLWSRAAEIDPLVEMLHENARAGRLTISGFDPQTGGAMGHYTQTRLAPRLSKDLPERGRSLCSEAIGRLLGWKFDMAHPKDSAFDRLVFDCARDIEAAASAQAKRDPIQYRLAQNFSASLQLVTANSNADRDSVMAENLEWSISRLPSGTKTIVWTASVHGARTPIGEHAAMGSYVAGNGRTVKFLAIVALSGAYAASRAAVVEIPLADPDSLEGHFWAVRNADMSYIDRESLRREGNRKSRILQYGRYVDGDWGERFDGVLVLAAEAPPTYVRPAKPMQAILETP